MTEITTEKENVVAEIRLLLTKKGKNHRLQVKQKGNMEELRELTEALINSEKEFYIRALMAKISTIVDCYCKYKGIRY